MDFYSKDHTLTPFLWKTLQERINTMIFNSLQFLIFFPIILVSYYIIPHRLQNIWLLFASYIFYGFWNVKYCLILFICTLVTYLAALAIESVRTEFSLKKRVFIIALLFVLGILAGYKYTNFAVGNLISLFEKLGVHTRLHKFDIVLPVGISFFTFQAAGYLIDVYKGKISAEKDLIRYGLFVSFFPQLLSGPIGRADMLLPQYSKERNFQYKNFQSGLLLMIWGFFLKLVIADRAAILVDTVYGDFTKYTGLTIVFATAIYGVQIYCDFFGYSSMAIGSAKILGIDLPNNFDTPYLSASVKEFWRRWHISLSSWLRDYVYFPLGGSRCSTIRKYFNLAMTFFVSGIWHGSKWSFIFWGLLHGFYQITGDLLAPVRKMICSKLRINTQTGIFKVFRIILTFIMVDFAWLFFRADGFMNGLRMCKRIATQFHPLSLVGDAVYKLGLDQKNYRLLMFSIAVLLIRDILTYMGIDLKKWFLAQNWLFRELAAAFSILFIILVGIWGNSYHAANFIYFQF